MAAALTDRAWRQSSLERVEADLAALWAELGREAPVARAAMSNLVVFCRCPAGRAMDLALAPVPIPLEDVVQRHPARVIVLHHDPDPPPGPASATAPDARVAVLTFGPLTTRYGVEQIVVRSACGEAALPSIVRPLLLGDMPTSIWWAEDLSASRPLASLTAIGRQLVFDSRDWRDVRTAVLALAPLLAERFGPDLADVNWRRLTPLRQALAYAITSGGRPRRPLPASIRIGHRPEEAALAWLLVGWLRQVVPPPDLDDTADSWDPAITVQANLQRDDDLLTLFFGEGLELRLGARSVTVEDALAPAPLAVTVPLESEAEAVAAELRMLTPDASFRAALAALAERFAGA